MKPGTIVASHLKYPEQTNAVSDWLKANGCRWLIPAEARIIITGNYIIPPCWNIKNTRQAGTLWPKRLPQGWSPPVKIRRFRIRVPLKLRDK